MAARENQMRAAELFEYARHELTRLLQNAPEFGSVTLELVFYEGDVSRVVTSASVQRKPRTPLRAGVKK